jgi:hypothetical protein
MNANHSSDTPPYSPLYFLSALGAGGLSVTFFLYLLFWVPHKGRPVPNFEDISAAFLGGSTASQLMIATAVLGIAVTIALHVKYLVWNIRRFNQFRNSPAYEQLRTSNAETQLMAVPLTLAMAVNAGFIVGLVFVPGLWSVVEYLFPFAMVAFFSIGLYGLSIMGDFWGRVLTHGGFDCGKNNSFAQLLPAFAFSMVAVGLAAPAAMSTSPLVAGISYIGSSFFVVTAIVLAGVKMVLGFRSMMENGTNDEAAPTLWMLIPIMTIVGITMMRQEHGMHVHFNSHTTAAGNFSLLTTLVSIQLLFGLIGYKVLRGKGYFARFVFGSEKSPGSYALVCPGVALSVLGFFFINKGLVGVGIVDKYSAVYWIMTAAVIALQLTTAGLLLKLNAKHFGKNKATPAMVAAE